MTELEKTPETPAKGPYHIALDVFEGPLDLLLHLIKENQMDIYNIPISTITQQYLAYVRMLEELNLEVAGEFLVMAATLAHIKSKMLLPPEPVSDEENALDGPDPREELVRRLLLYQKYKHAAEELALRPHFGRDIFAREHSAATPIPTSERELAEISVFKLVEHFHKVLKTLHEKSVVHNVINEPVSIRECAESIAEKIKTSTEGTVEFSQLFTAQTITRVRVVTTFLALLDLLRKGYIKIFQNELFSEIQLMGTSELFTNFKYEEQDEYRYTTTPAIDAA